MGLPAERSLKFTNWGEQPEVGEAEKFADIWLLLLKVNENSIKKIKKHCFRNALVYIAMAV